MMDMIFSISNLLVMPFWLAMILLPRWRWTVRIMASLWPVAPAALLYATLVLPNLPALLPMVSSPELGVIAAMLGTPTGATVAWVHFLAFDLFVGRWVYLDGRRLGISAWLVSPILFFVLMLGPLGLALYLATRLIKTRSLALVSEQ
ncbi:MAG: ABA4-like family protein [Caldilinea sp.]